MNIGEQNLFIGGQWMPSESGETYESLDPFTGKTATRVSTWFRYLAASRGPSACIKSRARAAPMSGTLGAICG
jgi:hypothetical protein